MVYIEIHPNEEPIGSWLEMDNFEAFLTLGKKSDWLISVNSIESW